MNSLNPALKNLFSSVAMVKTTVWIRIKEKINITGFFLLYSLFVAVFTFSTGMATAISNMIIVIVSVSILILLIIFSFPWGKVLSFLTIIPAGFFLSGFMILFIVILTGISQFRVIIAFNVFTLMIFLCSERVQSPDCYFGRCAFCTTGLGINVYAFDTIFDKFTRADAASITKYGLTDAGLTIKNILKQHIGWNYFNSRHNMHSQEDYRAALIERPLSLMEDFSGNTGTSFTKERWRNISVIPLCTGTKTEPPENVADTILTEYTPSILVVEDNTYIRKLLVKMLRSTYFIHEAAEGMEALKVLKNTDEIDLVLTDIMMPGMDGYELLRWIRNNERFVGLPVVILSSSADSDMKIEFLNHGATDYITKPFNSSELLLRIHNQVELKLLRNSALKSYNNLMVELKKTKSRPPISEESAAKIESLCEFIKEKYDQDISREVLAEVAGFNPDTLSRIFNQHTGMTLSDYVYELRIDDAKQRLVQTDNTVIRISIDTGFDNIRTFNRIFKKIVGVTPGEFRKMR